MPKRPRENPAEILLVEDNDADALLFAEVAHESKLQSNIHRVKSGLEALSFLRKENGFRTAPTPSLVVLDMKMPGMSGLELLKQIKEDCDLRQIPVIFLTSSSNLDDVSKAYKGYANSYMVKPLDIGSFERMMEAFKLFWLQTARLPA